MDPTEAIKAAKAKIIAEAKADAERVLASAKRQAEALDDDAREMEKLVTLADKYGYMLVPKVAQNGNGLAEIDIHVDRNGPAYKAAISVSENALKAAGSPLELSQLFDACVSARVPLAGKRPQSTLSAYLSHQNSTVESIRRGVYWLKGVDVP
jgi:hypothetical protein